MWEFLQLNRRPVPMRNSKFDEIMLLLQIDDDADVMLHHTQKLINGHGHSRSEEEP